MLQLGTNRQYPPTRGASRARYASIARSRARAAGRGRAAGGKASQTLPVLTLDLCLGTGGDLGLGDQHQVHGRQPAPDVPPERFPEQPLGPVAPDGAPELPAHGQPQAILTPLARRRDEEEERTVDPVPAAEGPLELGGGAQALPGPETGSARRRPRLRFASVPSGGAA